MKLGTMARKVLFVFTSNDRLVNTSTKTGWYLPEAAHPFYAFRKQGIKVDFVSEKGGRPPLDQSSVHATKGDTISEMVRSKTHVLQAVSSLPC